MDHAGIAWNEVHDCHELVFGNVDRNDEVLKEIGRDLFPQLLDVACDDARVQWLAVHELQRPGAHPQDGCDHAELFASGDEAMEPDVRERARDIGKDLHDLTCGHVARRPLLGDGHGDPPRSNCILLEHDRSCRRAAGPKDPPLRVRPGPSRYQKPWIGPTRKNATKPIVLLNPCANTAAQSVRYR